MQEWNPSLYDQKHAYVYSFGEDLLGLLEPKPGERILDVGCGNGHLTHRIAESGAHVIGIDCSDQMIEAAHKAYPNLDFKQTDATNFTFPFLFDSVFSNAALHWILGAENAVICISRSLRLGGKFVAEFGGKGNVDRVVNAVDSFGESSSPSSEARGNRVVNAVEKVLLQLGQKRPGSAWYFPSIGEYAVLLEKHRLLVRSAWLFDRPTKMDGGEFGLQSWLEMFGGRLLNHLSAETKQRVIRLAEDDLRPHLFRDGTWTIDYRRLRVVAERW